MNYGELQAPGEERNFFPPMSLLKSKSGTSSDSTDLLRESVRRINQVLSDSRVDAHIINVVEGPASVRYELELDRGVRLASVKRLASDMALALGCPEVAIAPVVGKCSVVGIDVPKSSAEALCLREVLDTDGFRRTGSSLTFALGKDASGRSVICDLGKQRHLLIGGTTGSGKSTLIHSLIMSLIYHVSLRDLRFLMIDTAGPELLWYNRLPHMLIPLVTEPQKAAGAISWLDFEMRKRYKLLTSCSCSSLDAYNRLMADSGEPVYPRIVAVVDNFSHLFSGRDSSLEETFRSLILRGHAVGIHLVLTAQQVSMAAFQRLAELRNAGRISLALPGKQDSIAYLEHEGAEKLSGAGDLLYLPIGSGSIQHIQGCFVSDSELQAVVNYFWENSDCDMQTDQDSCALPRNQSPAPETSDTGSGCEGLYQDELLPNAVDIILETGQASVSMLQRRLKLGYARASRILDEMEERGMVGPFRGSSPREIRITREQWEQMKWQTL